MEIKYIGHSTFLINGSKTIITDPWIKDNPSNTAVKIEDLEKIDYILISHGHFDHIADVETLYKKFNSEIWCNFEISNYLANKKVVANGAYMGGKIKFPWGFIKFFPAFHGSSTPEGYYAGLATSILINLDNTTIYFAGDTCLTVEMQLIQKYNVDLAMLPIGGRFTMDIEEALDAVKLIKPKYVIPMHYNTFELIKVDPQEFKNLVEKETTTKCFVLKSGEKINI
jgi:L-ascorbate metabolism protein UlaG (beta-lactamase superfamily)